MFYFQTQIRQKMDDPRMKHIVIGHSQVKNLQNYSFPEKPDLNFQIEFRYISGGKAPELIELVKKEIISAVQPLRITAIVWQNSNWNITISEVENIVLDMEHFLHDHPLHRVAFPECLYVPDQERLWDKVAKINLVLANYNQRQGFDRYPLFKVAMQYSKEKRSLVVRQTSFKEYNQNLSYGNSQKDGNNNSKGYHLDEGEPKRRFATLCNASCFCEITKCKMITDI